MLLCSVVYRFLVVCGVLLLLLCVCCAVCNESARVNVVCFFRVSLCVWFVCVSSGVMLCVWDVCMVVCC